MKKITAFILYFALCACEHPNQDRFNRIQFKDYNYMNNTSLSIVVVDSIEFLVNHKTGQMERITKTSNHEKNNKSR